jgi:hypothetical protein
LKGPPSLQLIDFWQVWNCRFAGFGIQQWNRALAVSIVVLMLKAEILGEERGLLRWMHRYRGQMDVYVPYILYGNRLRQTSRTVIAHIYAHKACGNEF